MNRKLSFYVAGFSALSVTILISFFVNEKFYTTTDHLIIWYMIWKFLHDKNKD